MTCTVTAPPTQSTGLPTQISQCNGSGPTGASTVTCTATITNNFLGSIPATTTPPPVTPTPTGTTPPGTGGGGNNGGGGGNGGGGDNDGGGGGGSGGGGSGDGSGGGGSSTGGGGGNTTSPPGGGDTTTLIQNPGDDTSTGKDVKSLPHTGLEVRFFLALGLLMLLTGAALGVKTSRRPFNPNWRNV
jgi:LPXTG-motif cell wall-anchored protein